jgi:hypothetical protein
VLTGRNKVADTGIAAQILSNCQQATSCRCCRARNQQPTLHCRSDFHNFRSPIGWRALLSSDSPATVETQESGHQCGNESETAGWKKRVLQGLFLPSFSRAREIRICDRNRVTLLSREYPSIPGTMSWKSMYVKEALLPKPRWLRSHPAASPAPSLCHLTSVMV